MGNGKIRKGTDVDFDLPSSDKCIIDFVGYMELGMNKECEVLNDEDIMEMQEECPVVSELKCCMLKRRPVARWHECLQEFRRFAERFCWCWRKGSLCPLRRFPLPRFILIRSFLLRIIIKCF